MPFFSEREFQFFVTGDEANIAIYSVLLESGEVRNYSFPALAALNDNFVRSK